VKKYWERLKSNNQILPGSKHNEPKFVIFCYYLKSYFIERV